MITMPLKAHISVIAVHEVFKIDITLFSRIILDKYLALNKPN